MIGIFFFLVVGLIVSRDMNHQTVSLAWEYFKGEGCKPENRIGISHKNVGTFSTNQRVKWNTSTLCLEDDSDDPEYLRSSVGFICNQTEPGFYYAFYGSWNCDGEASQVTKTMVSSEMKCIYSSYKGTSEILKCQSEEVNQTYAHIVFYKDSKCTRNIMNRMQDMYVKLDTCFRFPKNSGGSIEPHFIIHKEENGNVTYTAYSDKECTTELPALRRNLMKGTCQIEKPTNSTRRSMDDEGSIEYLGLGVSETEDEPMPVNPEDPENAGKTIFYSLAVLGVILAILF